MRFLIVDDHALIVSALTALLRARYPGATVDSAADAASARALAARHRGSADLLILDLMLPGCASPLQLLAELARRDPGLKILVLSARDEPANVFGALRLGACGFVPKNLDPAQLSAAIDLALRGGVYVPTSLRQLSQRALDLPGEAAAAGAAAPLTPRQREVLAALARGLTIKGICRELSLSEGTVKTHVAAIYRSFGARNRTEALLAARRQGLCHDPESP